MAGRNILYRFEVWNRGAGGPRIDALRADVRALGIGILRSARKIALYFVEGELAPEELSLLGRFLFSDPVEEVFEWREVGRGGRRGQPDAALHEGEGLAVDREAASERIVEICRKPGVTDPVAIEVVRAAHELGISGIKRAATGVRWELEADWLDDAALSKLTRVLLANAVIERWEFGEIEPIFPEGREQGLAVEHYDLAAMNDGELLGLSAKRRLALDLEEMRAIQAWFGARGRPATDVELEMLAQTWSEHCVHKTFKADVEVRNSKGRPYPPVVHGIFNIYIRKTTEEIGAPWVRSAFVDNAGIVSFDGDWDISFKVETHNHPSAVEPFGGANTGVGGVIRDVMGVSARPIAATDILCFGPPDMPEDQVPQGTLHPRLIARGVVAGVEDYGNKMGIPTVNGAVHFHPGYAANPLVYCGCVGLAPAGVHRNAPRAGDRVIVLGGRTGRDGIRGATFSSMKMDGSTGDVAGASVQIGDPIVQKRALDVLLAARDAGLYDAVTDCGAGGLSSAVGEMASALGAEIELSRIGTKYPGLSPWELWLSEAQERMVLAVPSRHLEAFAALCSRFESEFWDIGAFRSDGELILKMKGEVVLGLSMEFVHKGLPRKHLVAERSAGGTHGGHGNPDSVKYSGDVALPADTKTRLLALLSDMNIASREQVVRRYDHEVQGGTAVKPFAGPYGDAPSDAAVLKPQGTDGTWGIALSNALRPDYGELDPYRGAWAAVDEAIRNAVAVGADPERIAILDNFCMGDPNDPAVMWALLESARGLREAALAFGTPIISGKDSFYNEYLGPDGRRHAVPPSLLVSALGFVPDVKRAVTSFLKKPGDSLWLVGDFKPVYLCAAEVPEVSFQAREAYRAFSGAARAGEVVAAHDLSDGGLAVALAEMCVGGRLGAQITLPDADVGALAFFGETAGCLLVEVGAGHEGSFGARFGPGLALRLGEVKAGPAMEIHEGGDNAGCGAGGPLLSVSIDEMLAAWKGDAWKGDAWKGDVLKDNAREVLP
jgi:phosphoribosylformylglycinamidine synthase